MSMPDGCGSRAIAFSKTVGVLGSRCQSGDGECGMRQRLLKLSTGNGDVLIGRDIGQYSRLTVDPPDANLVNSIS